MQRLKGGKRESTNRNTLRFTHTCDDPRQFGRAFPATKFWHCKNRVTDMVPVDERSEIPEILREASTTTSTTSLKRLKWQTK